jgi:hypothetical protein
MVESAKGKALHLFSMARLAVGNHGNYVKPGSLHQAGTTRKQTLKPSSKFLGAIKQRYVAKQFMIDYLIYIYIYIHIDR